jgi:hypothetical protein
MRSACAGFVVITLAHQALAQQPSRPSSLFGDSDSQQSAAGPATAQQDPQLQVQNPSPEHKTVAAETVGVLRKKSVFFPDLATNRNRLSTGEKFKLFVDKTIAPSTFVSATTTSAYHQARDSYPGWGQGWGAYGDRYGAALANSASTNFFGTFLFPSLFHEDPRHFFSLRAGFRRKLGYALARQVVTRTDDGGKAFNWSRVLSVFASESIANTYLPPEERTAEKTFERSGARFAFGFASALVKEYWPIVFKKLGVSGGNSNNPLNQP